MGYEGEASGSAIRTSILYEEIGDVKSSFTYTQNVLYGLSTTGATSRLTSDPIPEAPAGVAVTESHNQEDQTHNYELIKAAEYQSIDDAYRIRHCEAYGVTSSVDRSCDPIRSGDPNILSDPTRSYDPERSYYDSNKSCDPGQEENCSVPAGHCAVATSADGSCDPCEIEECPAYGMTLQ